jgi:cystathionine beta-lyase
MSVEFNFDKPVDRHGTSSFKWDKYKKRDIIPLWVADMDFPSPPEVIEALQERVSHGVFGYASVLDSLPETVQNMLRKEYAWEIKQEWMIWLPGLVCGLNVTCRAVGKKNDEVITFTPIYPPFMTAPTLSGRSLITAPLHLDGNRWEMDLDEFERMLTARTRLVLFCNPHNPTGRVWSQKELEDLAALAERHNLIICSDEIHSGLILDEKKRHIPLATLSPEIARRTITLNAPSKTYNIPGLGCSFAVISDPELRRNFKAAMNGIVPHVNLLGYVAALAAYRHGEKWRRELITYLRGNHDLVCRMISDMPGMHTTPVEATYLSWIDTRQTGINQPARFFEKAGVGLSDGDAFGLPGYVRLNFGCRRGLLEEALKRMKKALTDRLY